MPFLEHVGELRKRLFIVVIVVLVGSLASYNWAWEFFDLVMAPLEPLMEGAKWIFLNPFEAFTLRFKVSLYIAILVGSPVIIWQVMAFFLPALKPKERRYVVPTFFIMVLLFSAGVAFCYMLVLEPAFQWMVTQGAKDSLQMWRAPDFFSAVSLLMLGFGIGFQVPVVVFYLILFRIVSYGTLRAQWRTVYVVLMLVASVATPDWSPVTMGLLFGALVSLYEGSMLFARVMMARRISAERRQELEA